MWVQTLSERVRQYVRSLSPLQAEIPDCPARSQSLYRLSYLTLAIFVPGIMKDIILPVVLCGCQTWSLTLREERKLRVFENMVLRRIFGPRSDEVTGGMEETA